MIYDVIVVGAGPAGAVLAYDLARRGLRVLILEKAGLPRYKACGGGLTAKTLRKLPFDASATFEMQASGGILTYAGLHLLTVDLDPPVAWLVMRDRFDFFCVQRAVEAGAQLMDGVAVSGVEETDGPGAVVVARTERGDFSARFLAGADGVNSIVARSADLLPKREIGVAIEAEIDVPPAALAQQGTYATFDFGALPHGYGWIFPKADHLSVGVFQARAGRAVGLKRYLDRFVACQPVLRGRTGLSWRGHRVPLGGSREMLHRGRRLLVGDAANLADPWLGEGIYWAIISAQLAAEVLVQAAADERVGLGTYTDRVDAQIVSQLRHARRLANTIYRFPRQGSQALARSPFMQQAVFGAIRGDCTLESLNRALTFGLPRIVLEGLRR